MHRVLVTGMSGTGKSTALKALARRGFPVVDTDEPGWSVWTGDEWIWDESRMSALLARVDEPALFVSGCVSNQGRFYDRFDAIVLLSAPAEVILERIRSRVTNSYGKTRDEHDLILSHHVSVEPRLRRTCSHEIDATRPLSDVVEKLVEIASAA